MMESGQTIIMSPDGLAVPLRVLLATTAVTTTRLIGFALLGSFGVFAVAVSTRFVLDFCTLLVFCWILHNNYSFATGTMDIRVVPANASTLAINSLVVTSGKCWRMMRAAACRSV